MSPCNFSANRSAESELLTRRPATLSPPPHHGESRALAVEKCDLRRDQDVFLFRRILRRAALTMVLECSIHEVPVLHAGCGLYLQLFARISRISFLSPSLRYATSSSLHPGCFNLCTYSAQCQLKSSSLARSFFVSLAYTWDTHDPMFQLTAVNLR